MIWVQCIWESEVIRESLLLIRSSKRPEKMIAKEKIRNTVGGEDIVKCLESSSPWIPSLGKLCHISAEPRFQSQNSWFRFQTCQTMTLDLLLKLTWVLVPLWLLIICTMCVCVCVCSVMSASLWLHGALAYQALLSMEFSRQECWSMLPFPTPGNFPNPEIKPASLGPSALASGFFTTVIPRKPICAI